VANAKDQLQQGAASLKSTAQSAAQSATLAAQAAANQAAHAAARQGRSAASGVNAGMRTGSRSARDWIAPRLENAADYTTSTAAPAISATLTKTVAPRVSSALRTTAQKVSTQEAKRARSLRSALTWTALSATVLAAAGAVATVVWRRYREAMAADTEHDPGIHSVSGEGTPAKAAPGEDPQAPGEAEEPAPHGAPSTR
jgi:trimeric autotransporter adhesin